MSEVVSKEDYWQIILNDPSKVGQIMTEDEKFNKIADFVYTVVQNTLLTSEDEDYLKKYEEMIDISGEGLTPYQRKVNILYMLSGKNYIPLNLVRRGLINMGVSAFDIELLKDENKLVVHTDCADDTQFKRVTTLLERVLPENLNIERYNHNMEISWRDINKYAACTNIEDMIAVNPDYKNDVTSDGEWVYPLPNMDYLGQRYPNNIAEDAGFGCKFWSPWNETASVIKFAVPLPNARNCMDAFRSNKVLKHLVVNAPMATHIHCIVADCVALETLEIYAPEAVSGHVGLWYGCTCKKLTHLKLHIPKANQFGDLTAPALQEAEIELPALSVNAGINQSQLNKESAIRLFNSLSEQSNVTFTLGIHVDYKNDEEVLAAIANAEAKGWTLTVQWNGTPSAQASVTYGLRKPPIYARVGEMERPAGIIERILDWGHYVTNPEDYQEFSSLEEAYEHFNLEMQQI